MVHSVISLWRRSMYKSGRNFTARWVVRVRLQRRRLITPSLSMIARITARCRVLIIFGAGR